MCCAIRNKYRQIEMLLEFIMSYRQIQIHQEVSEYGFVYGSKR